MRNANLLILLGSALCAGGARPSLAASQWYRFQAGKWELFSDAGQRSGERILRRMVDSQRVLREVAPELAGAGDAASFPLRIVVFRSRKDFAQFRRGPYQRGLFLPGMERDQILILDAGPETETAALHELVHAMLHRAGTAAPGWFEEGLADYYSTLGREGRRVRLGSPPAGRLELLRSNRWLEAERLAAIRGNPELAADETPAALYYAESWALVRWMMEQAHRRDQVKEFLVLLGGGRPQETAFAQAFEMPMDEALHRAKALVDRPEPARGAAEERMLAGDPREAEVERRVARPPEPELVRAGLLLAAGFEQEGASLAGLLARRYPREAQAQAMAGTVALRRGDYASARQSLEQAIALGGPSPATQFEYAMLVRDTKGPDAVVEQALKQAVAIEPAFGEAWLVLGNWLLGRGRTAEAAECLKKAAELEPRRSVAWEAYGRALLETGKKEEARDAAHRASVFALTVEQNAMAQALVREIEARPAARKPAPAAAPPQGWQPVVGDARVAGRLVHIDCGTRILQFRIEVKPRLARTPAESVVLASDQPNRIMLRGAGGGKREFVCGAQSPAPVVEAGYVTAPPTAAHAEEGPAAGAPKAPAAAARAKRRAPPRRAASRPPQPPAGEIVWLEFK